MIFFSLSVSYPRSRMLTFTFFPVVPPKLEPIPLPLLKLIAFPLLEVIDPA